MHTVGGQKGPCSEAAASEKPKDVRGSYVEALSDARTMLAVFFSLPISGAR